MKLMMFTPGARTSAIGRMASLVTHALMEAGHTVVVVRTENESLAHTQAHDFGTELVYWNQHRQVEDLAQSADVVIYQIGDNFAYHVGGVEWLSRLPGVVCLHDFFLGHLFTGWAEHHRQKARVMLGAWYGEKIANSFFGYSSSEAFITATKDVAPATEWIASMAHGVVTHSSWGLHRVLEACPGPVQVVPLAYSAPSGSLEQQTHLVRGEKNGSKFEILTVGHVNSNKRAESVIRAIGSSDVLRPHARYRLIGAVQPEVSKQLSALAGSLGVDLVILGEADSNTLSDAFARADVACCLRWPSLEAASASTIEAMLCGKAVIVTDTGFYGELPDLYVRKIQPSNEVPDLQRVLERLYSNEAERLGLGASAAKWASTTFTASNYAKHLIDTCLMALRAAPMIKATQSSTGVLRHWGASDQLIMLPEIIQPLRLFDACTHEQAIRLRSGPTKKRNAP